MIRRSPKYLVLCGGAVVACALDNRLLNSTDSPCQDASQCVDLGGNAAGENTAGQSARGGSAAGGKANSDGRGGANVMIGGSSKWVP
jgi:hypothetical protein